MVETFFCRNRTTFPSSVWPQLRGEGQTDEGKVALAFSARNFVRCAACLLARPISYVPQVVAYLGKNAQKKYVTFSTDKYRNKNTRQAYRRNACEFFEWCESKNPAFDDIESFQVSVCIEEMLAAGKAKRTVNQSLATVHKHFFDWVEDA